MADHLSHHEPGNLPAPRHEPYPPPVAQLAAYEGAEPAGSSSTVLHFFLTALRRWGFIAIPASLLLAAAAAGIVWLLYEPEYQAAAWFQVSADEKFLAFPDGDQERAHEQFVETQVELVRSPLVLGPVVGNPEIANLRQVREEESPVDWLSQEIQVRSVGQSEFLQIQFQSSDKNAAQKIVDAVSEQYLAVYRQDSTLRHQRLLDSLQQEKDRCAGEIANLRNRVRALHKQAFGKDPYVVEREDVGVKAGRSDDFESALHQMLMEAVVKRELIESRLKAFTSQIPGSLAALPQQDIEKALAADAQLQVLREKLAKRESQLERLRVRAADVASALENRTDEKNPLADVDRRKLVAQLEYEINQLTSQLELSETERRAQIAEDFQLTAWRNLLKEQKPEISEEDVAWHVEADKDYLALQALVREKEIELDNYHGIMSSGTNHSSVRRLQAELEERQRALEKYRTQFLERLIASVQEQAVRKKLDELDTLVAEVRQARAHQAVLRDKLAASTSERSLKAERVGEMTIDLEFARQALDQELALYQRMTERLLELKTEVRAPDRVVLRQSAEVSGKPMEGWPIRNMLLAAIAAAGLPFGLAMLWEWRVKRVSDADQFALELGIPVLGELTRLPGSRRAMLSAGGASPKRDAALYEQSALILSDNISNSADLRDVKVMAVSSAVKGEGKSYLSAKLAVNLARVMKGKVLLVDGDIRYRTVERLLDLPEHVGLAETLEGECTVDDAIQMTSSGLHVMSAGIPGHHSCDLLRNGVLNGIFRELRQRYAYIIIDTPPILSAGESLSFGKVSDGTLICALRDVSRIPQTRKALARLVSVGIRPLGAILAGVSGSNYEESYYGYYALPDGKETDPESFDPEP